MSISTRRGVPLALLSLAVGLAVAGPLAAQERDPLQRVRQMKQIQAQRIERVFKEAREYAYRLVRSDPSQLARARERIRTALGDVEDDDSLAPARRALLVRTLKWDVDNLAAEAARKQVARGPDPVRRAARDDARGLRDARQAEEERRHQQAADVIRSRGRQVADARGMRRDSENRILGVNTQIEKSAQAPVGDYELPADWAEKSKRRSPENKLTAQEKALLAALKKPISVDFKEQTFSDVIDYFEKATGQSISVDKQALEEAGVKYETTISLRLNKVAARYVLKKVLADLGLAYYIKDGTIEVTTAARAREMVTTRTYYIGDLVSFANTGWPAIDQAQMVQTVQMIVQSILQIDPNSWRVNNPDAPGSITFNPITMSLIVKQSAEMHMMLGGGH